MMSPPGGPAAGQPARPRSARRGVAPLRDFPTILWLCVAGVVAVLQPFIVESTWLLVHLALLGALSHAMLAWSTFFAQALLKTPESADPPRLQTLRFLLLAVGAACVFVGLPISAWWLVLTGALVVAAAVLIHAAAMLRRLRAALPGRFTVTVRYYLAASLCLPVGAAFGVLLARWPASDLFGRLLLAHTVTMLLGWVGLTVMGTLVTFWPTLLRTRVHPQAALRTQQALPVLLTGIALVDAGALADLRLLAVAGLVLHLCGAVWWGSTLLRPLLAAPPRRAPGVFAASALMWGLVLLLSLVLHVATTDSWGQFAAGYLSLTLVAVLGFALQLLTGALSQLVPTVLGGGPAVRAAVDREFDRFTWLRWALLNAGLVVALLPVPGSVRRVALGVVMVTVLSLVPILLRGIVVGVRAKRA
ncbi:MAG TPA: hypothetical protein K8V08_05110 [Brevibacterium senegalense]|uniref:Nitrite reductase (NO-forming) n=1 Tax=Brevibacterium senegalense TaxID=1033736 RepID=A0A921MCV7_9MICO|nr:hypothetical protein [Brevibacterium senegalense]